MVIVGFSADIKRFAYVTLSHAKGKTFNNEKLGPRQPLMWLTWVR